MAKRQWTVSPLGCPILLVVGYQSALFWSDLCVPNLLARSAAGWDTSSHACPAPYRPWLTPDCCTLSFLRRSWRPAPSASPATSTPAPASPRPWPPASTSTHAVCEWAARVLAEHATGLPSTAVRSRVSRVLCVCVSRASPGSASTRAVCGWAVQVLRTSPPAASSFPLWVLHQMVGAVHQRPWTALSALHMHCASHAFGCT